MAIPIGTTSRQMRSLACWSLVVLTVLGMATWWWPSYLGSAALIMGLLTVLMLWVSSRIVSVDRTIPANPLNWALVGPGFLLYLHVVRQGILSSDTTDSQGGLSASILTQVALVALATMLVQGLLPKAARRRMLLSVVGAAMFGGVVVAMIWEPAAPIRPMLSMVGFSGVGVWLSCIWGVTEDGGVPRLSETRRREIRLACIGFGGVGVVALAVLMPGSAAVAVGLLSAVLLPAGLLYSRYRRTMLSAGLIGAALSAVAWYLWPGRLILPDGVGGVLGLGDQAFLHVSARSSGLAVVQATTGWLGLGWMALGSLLCIVRLLYVARSEGPEVQLRATVWAFAAAAMLAALMAPGGLFSPAAVLGTGLVFGLLPVMSDQPDRKAGGLWLLVAFVLLFGLLGVITHSTLIAWVTFAVGGSDWTMHFLAGFFVALLLYWLLGARRWYLGLLGLLLALAAGGAGEFVQKLTPRRGVEWADFIAHSIGSLLAMIPFVLSYFARGCESTDALETKIAKYKTLDR